MQLFDSWVGELSAPDYTEFVLPASRKVFAGVADLGVPRIHFGVGTGELLELMVAAGADVLGVDWRVPLDVARARVGDDVTLQGNLDPAVCLAEWERRGAARARCAAHAPATDRDTSSTWATACSPRPIPECSVVSSSSCTALS